MLRVNRQHHLIRHELNLIDLWMRDCPGDAKGYLMVQHHVEHLMGMARQNRQLDLGIQLLKLLHEVRKDVEGCDEHGRDGQLPFDIAIGALDGLLPLLQRVQDAFGVRQKNLAFLGQADHMAGALEQLAVQRALQSLDPHAHRRLGQV